MLQDINLNVLNNSSLQENENNAIFDQIPIDIDELLTLIDDISWESHKDADALDTAMNVADTNDYNPIFYPQDSLFEEIHHAAFLGDVSKISLILAACPQKINIQDNSGCTPLIWAVAGKQFAAVEFLISQNANLHIRDFQGNTPLFYAVFFQSKELVDFFLKNGALLDDLNNIQANIVDIAALSNEKTLSDYLEKKIALSSEVINKLAQTFKSILVKELLIAKKEGKKLLVMLGESHFAYKVVQLEKYFYQIAKELGINTLLVEQRKKFDIIYPSDLYAKNDLKMEVICIDNFDRDDASLDPLLDERNTVMAQEIHMINQNAILRTGSNHLYGFSQVNETKVNIDQYRIVPFNLSSLLVQSIVFHGTMSDFSQDPNKVIQVLQNGISHPDTAMQFWNNLNVAKASSCIENNPPIYAPLKLTAKKRMSKREASTRPSKRAKFAGHSL